MLKSDAGKIIVIVLTGGPCAGKSSAMAIVRSELMERGIMVLSAPEMATIFFAGGVFPRQFESSVPDTALQETILKAQLDMEDIFKKLLLMHKGSVKVLILDRGTLDGAAYVGNDKFYAMLSDSGISYTDLIKRYDGVIHLVTAADGAESFYNHNNAARTETPMVARELDRKTRDAWVGHENLRIVGNYQPGTRTPISFEEKMRNLVREVFHMVGVPEPMQIQRKFKLEDALDLYAEGVDFSRTYIEQAYLPSEDGIERRVRKMVPQAKTRIFAHQPSEALYVYTETERLNAFSRRKREKVISAREYLDYMSKLDPEKARYILKHRTSFAYMDQYFRVDEFANVADPVTGQLLVTAEVHLSSEDAPLVWPDFLGPQREVTQDDRYSNSSLAANAY